MDVVDPASEGRPSKPKRAPRKTKRSDSKSASAAGLGSQKRRGPYQNMPFKSHARISARDETEAEEPMGLARPLPHGEPMDEDEEEDRDEDRMEEEEEEEEQLVQQ
jgi:hypothetical protein